MKLRCLIILLFQALLWSGCAPQPATPNIITSLTLEPTVTSGQEPTVTPPILATPTATTAPTPVLSPAPITQACVTIGQNAPEKTSGMLALENFVWEGAVNANYTVTAFLLDLEQQKIMSVGVPGRLTQILDVSPDRRFLLYEYDTGGPDEYRLAVTDSQGRVVMDFDDRVLPESWWDYSNWHNTNLLRVVIIDLGKRRTLPRLYNVTTGEYTPLETNWSAVYKGDDLDWGLDSLAVDVSSADGANLVYDPAVTRVVYPRKGQVVSLADTLTRQEIANIRLPGWGRLPRWSNDGEHLALIASTDPKAAPGHDEFYIVSRDGPEFKRLTYLTEQFDKVHISEYAWSPDGKRIAFWLNTTADDPMLEGTQSELAVLDIESGEITRLCIEGISAPMRHEIQMTHTQPVWSPDGSQIAFAQLDSSRANTYNVLVVDLETQTAFKVAANKEPIGWMLKEP